MACKTLQFLYTVDKRRIAAVATDAGLNLDSAVSSILGVPPFLTAAALNEEIEGYTRVSIGTDEIDSELAGVLNNNSLVATNLDGTHEFYNLFGGDHAESKENVNFVNNKGKFSVLVNDKVVQICSASSVPDSELNLYYENEDYFFTEPPAISNSVMRTKQLVNLGFSAESNMQMHIVSVEDLIASGFWGAILALAFPEGMPVAVSPPRQLSGVFSNCVPAMVKDPYPAPTITHFWCNVNDDELMLLWREPIEQNNIDGTDVPNFGNITTGERRIIIRIPINVSDEEQAAILVQQALQVEFYLKQLMAAHANIVYVNPVDITTDGDAVEYSTTIVYENAHNIDTQDEIIGYNVYVKTDENGGWGKVNDSLIPRVIKHVTIANYKEQMKAQESDKLIYAVTAMDIHQNESKLSAQIQIDQYGEIRQLIQPGASFVFIAPPHPLENIKTKNKISVKVLPDLVEIMRLIESGTIGNVFANPNGDFIINVKSLDTGMDEKIRIQIGP